MNISKHYFQILFASFCILILSSCENSSKQNIPTDEHLTYLKYEKKVGDLTISREEYANKLYGFWLGECIANWTGLVTEMDKIGNIGEIKTGRFYTRNDWGQADESSIWGQGIPSDLSETIDFVLVDTNGVWGADDDTDVEYMYQHLLYTNHTSLLTGEQIKNGWLTHMMAEEENYLWVANQKAFDLMEDGLVPPATSDPAYTSDSIYDNYYEMIDAQLTTEIFGFLAPARPDVALKMAHLPIQTTARKDAEWISEFYVIMYSLASYADQDLTQKDKVFWMAKQARKRLPNQSYSAKMYDYVLSKYNQGLSWEQTRDSIYQRYQVDQKDGYTITSKNIYCNGCFAGGINYAASLVSLFYGEGDIVETIKIGVLAGWDSDNPTATWGGLLGFMIGKEGIEKAFNQEFSNKFNIHRTRQNFPNNGIDTFDEMARKGVLIVDRVVLEQMGGSVDLNNNVWYIPDIGNPIEPGDF